MNRKLSNKITQIAIAYEKLNRELPIAQTRDAITPIRCGKIKGVRVNNTNVWGVTAREWWKFCRIVN